MSNRLFAVVLVIFAAATMALGQGSAVRNTTQGGSSSAGAKGAASLPNGKVAVIDSAQFFEGIGEFKQQLDKLEAEFKPTTSKLEGLQQNLVKLDEELKQAGPTMDPKVYQQKAENLQNMKKEFDRAREDYQQELQKKSTVVLGPVREKIGKFMDTYAAKNEIVVIFDLGPSLQNGLVFFNSATNITDDFIKEYNKAYPVNSAPPQPAGR